MIQQGIRPLLPLSGGLHKVKPYGSALGYPDIY